MVREHEYMNVCLPPWNYRVCYATELSTMSQSYHVVINSARNVMLIEKGIYILSKMCIDISNV